MLCHIPADAESRRSSMCALEKGRYIDSGLHVAGKPFHPNTLAFLVLIFSTKLLYSGFGHSFCVSSFGDLPSSSITGIATMAYSKDPSGKREAYSLSERIGSDVKDAATHDLGSRGSEGNTENDRRDMHRMGKKQVSTGRLYESKDMSCC
jgi:hypothetical protein